VNHLPNSRLRLIMILSVVGFALVIGRAIKIQTIDARDLVRRADAQQRHVYDVPVPRGTITDRNGNQLAQQNLQFRPFLTVVPVGADVSFPNLDPTKHHVYSFSAAKKFELKLFAKDQSRTVHFDKPGVVALGCNIHDQMSAFIFVTDTGWTARTNAQGIATFADAPNAPTRVAVWHPYLRAPGGQVQQAIAATQRNLGFQVKLRPPPAMAMTDY